MGGGGLCVWACVCVCAVAGIKMYVKKSERGVHSDFMLTCFIQHMLTSRKTRAVRADLLENQWLLVTA